MAAITMEDIGYLSLYCVITSSVTVILLGIIGIIGLWIYPYYFETLVAARWHCLNLYKIKLVIKTQWKLDNLGIELFFYSCMYWLRQAKQVDQQDYCKRIRDVVEQFDRQCLDT